MASFCAEVLSRLDRTRLSLSVVFVGPATMQTLNRSYRGKDWATDVLSFSYGGDNVDGNPLLGEIVIAPAVAAQHARRFGTDTERELRKLLVHGILHLLGYDHETDRGAMNRLQSRLMRKTNRTFREVLWRDA